MGITKRLNFCQKILINNIYFAFNHVKIISKKSKKKGRVNTFSKIVSVILNYKKEVCFFKIAAVHFSI